MMAASEYDVLAMGHRRVGLYARQIGKAMSNDESFDVFFFFQAEDGIRDLTVTGVQTCALPILPGSTLISPLPSRTPTHTSSAVRRSALSSRCEPNGPRCVLGAATTMPQEARDRKSVV